MVSVHFAVVCIVGVLAGAVVSVPVTTPAYTQDWPSQLPVLKDHDAVASRAYDSKNSNSTAVNSTMVATNKSKSEGITSKKKGTSSGGSADGYGFNLNGINNFKSSMVSW